MIKFLSKYHSFLHYKAQLLSRGFLKMLTELELIDLRSYK